MGINLIFDLLDIVCSDQAGFDQFVSVASRLSGHRADLFVHQGLSEGRLVYFVMPVETETDHVNKHIFFVFAPVLDHEFASFDNTLGVRSVNSQNWHTKGLNNVSSLVKTPIISRIGCEADLIVSNYMESAITVEFRQFAHR